MGLWTVGKALLFMGGALVGLGVVFMLLSKWTGEGGGFGMLGRLPGDILIKREHTTFYFPISTSILLSIILSLVFYVVFRR